MTFIKKLGWKELRLSRYELSYKQNKKIKLLCGSSIQE